MSSSMLTYRFLKNRGHLFLVPSGPPQYIAVACLGLCRLTSRIITGILDHIAIARHVFQQGNLRTASRVIGTTKVLICGISCQSWVGANDKDCRPGTDALVQPRRKVGSRSFSRTLTGLPCPIRRPGFTPDMIPVEGHSRTKWDRKVGRKSSSQVLLLATQSAPTIGIENNLSRRRPKPT